MRRKFSPGSVRQRSKAKTSPGKPSAIEESPFVLTPSQIGRFLAGNLLFRNCPAVLHALIYVAGVSKAETAKMIGVTRGRIGHYVNGDEPVPEDRERQIYETLRDITEANEKGLDRLKGDPLFFNEAAPVAFEMVKACRKVLDTYEAAHQPKDDADEGEVA